MSRKGEEACGISIRRVGWRGSYCRRKLSTSSRATASSSAADVAKLKDSHDFLLRVRNELHFSTGKHQDQLTFEEQEKAAAALGFQGEGSLKAVEVFMRAYYRHASEIQPPSRLITHRLTDIDRPLIGADVVLGRDFARGSADLQGHI